MSLLHTAHFDVRSEAIPMFEARLARHAATTLAREPGCQRFEFYRDRDKPGRFLLIAIYANEDALRIHRESDHYLDFRNDVVGWLLDRKRWCWTPAQTMAAA